VATTWRNVQSGFAPGGGDFGFAGAIACFGAAGVALVGAAVFIIGVVLLALAPLAMTGGVTVVRAIRSLNEALLVVAGAVAGLAVVVDITGLAVVLRDAVTVIA